MLRMMCKSKIQKATVTETNLEYEGSIAIDKKIMAEADILPYEIVLVVNLNTGARFETYAIPAANNSGVIGLQGGAARLGAVGDKLIIIAYEFVEEEKAKVYKPKIVFLDEKNRLIKQT
ncbi:aspartate 1-decarboxylase [bacterium]|nr:aspartate 1-decarboxylase [bacterium]NIN93284.1 aspartate 1-decarboxylase [bacterium]NIO19079.1 aspartate 1-decarboxylase [bacterium]NIO74210.1 aspartate 1-decarboxylase [bacterium]